MMTLMYCSIDYIQIYLLLRQMMVRNFIITLQENRLLPMFFMTHQIVLVLQNQQEQVFLHQFMLNELSFYLVYLLTL